MKLCQPSPQPPDLHLDAVLRETAACCEQISRTILALERDLFLDTDGPQLPMTDLTKLQSLDFVRQSAEDIAMMLSRLSKAVPQAILVERQEILGPMKLKDLRDCIGGPQDEPSASKPLFAQQEIELF